MSGDGSKLESHYPSASNETQQQSNAVLQGKEVGEANKAVAGNQKKEILTAISQTPSKTKDLTQGNSYSREMPKIRMGTSRVIPKRNRAREYSNPVTKRGATHG